MKTKKDIGARSIKGLSLPLVAMPLCIGFAALTTPIVVAADDDDEEADDESDSEIIADTDEPQSGGIVWILETETTRLVVPADSSSEPIDAPNSDNRLTETSVELGAQWYGSIGNSTTAYIDVSLFYENNREHSQTTQHETFAELNEFWLETPLPGLDSALRSGLQEFEDDRGWWWNKERVGVQWHGETSSGWSYSVAALRGTNDFTTLNQPGDPEIDDIYHLLFQGDTDIGDKSQLSLYGLHSMDRSGTPDIGSLIPEGREDEADASLTHAGLGLLHEVEFENFGLVTLRGDIALLHGNERRILFEQDEEDDAEDDSEDEENETSPDDEEDLDVPGDNDPEVLEISGSTKTDINAWAIDIGISWQLPFTFEPVIEAGLATGSGTSSTNTGGSTTFRQTGLHDNGQDRGTYGNVLVPELSNLQVLSFAASLPIAEANEISIYHHRFRKMESSGELPGNELDLETDSISADIGRETGLYLQLEVFDDIELNFAISQFRYGQAFGVQEADKIDRFSFEVTYEY